MHEQTFRTCLFLILIKYYPKFRDSYTLIKILSWNFKIIEFTDVSTHVVAMALADATLTENGVLHQYSITAIGEMYLKENARGKFLTALDERYPEPSELVKGIRDNYMQSMLDEAQS